MGLTLTGHSYPVAALQWKYVHTRELPTPPVNRASLILIGADMPGLLVPVQPVVEGPPGEPITVCMQLDCSLQESVDTVPPAAGGGQCLHLTMAQAFCELFKNVECLC